MHKVKTLLLVTGVVTGFVIGAVARLALGYLQRRT